MEAVLTNIADYLGRQSWQIALLVVACALASWALRNRSAHVRYLLWLLVVAKCLTPPVVEVPLAVLPDRAPPVAAPIISTIPPQEQVAQPTVGERLLPTSTPPAREPLRLTTQQWLAVGWLAGVAVFACIALTKAARTILWLRRQRRTLPRTSGDSFDETFRSLRVKRPPRIWLIEGVGQPFVWGILRGDIYLPNRFAGIDDDEHRRNILAHEISHVLRFDAAVNILQIIAQGIFWFHPLLWWANQRIRREREKCCDEMAIAHLGARPKDYSSAIVSTLVQAQESIRPVPSLAVAGPVKNIEERIRAMLKPGRQFHRRPSLTVVALVVLIALLAVPTTVVLSAKTATQAKDQTADTPVATKEKPEQPRYPARTFNSKLAFRVSVKETPLGWPREIGRTPSVAPLQIPPCWVWHVQLLAPPEDWSLLAHEMSLNKIPGLVLNACTDSDLKYLADLRDLRSLGLGGTSITDASLEHLKGLTELEMLALGQTKITDAGLAHLKGLTGLHVLALSGTRISDTGLQHLQGLTGLSDLGLGGTQITDAGLRHLGNLTGLRYLRLANTRVTGTGLEHLKGLARLEWLELRGTPTTGPGLDYLKGLTGLTGVSLDDCRITDADLVHLDGLSGLTNLQLAGTQITDTGLVHVSKGLSRLHSLGLRKTRITDAALESLKGLTGLQSLSLEATPITDAGLEYIAGLSALRALQLTGTSITDAGLAHVKGLAQLQMLRLEDTRITDAGLESLKGLTGLQRLLLNGTRITDAGLKHLKGLTELVYLGLTGTQITGPGLVHIKGFTGLEDLLLDNTPMTDAGLEHLRGLTGLRSLNLSGTQVTDAGTQQLKQSLPNLTITRGQPR